MSYCQRYCFPPGIRPMSLVLLTNVTQYSGPGAVDALARDGHAVGCSDASFVDGDARRAFDKGDAAIHALAAQTPDCVHAEVTARWGVPDAIVSNDVYPITRNDIEAIPADDLLATFRAIVMIPI